ncbi:ArsB/NhaD family transporter [bacterium]|nr:ArsB/NhaD family transporter [bacterium]
MDLKIIITVGIFVCVYIIISLELINKASIALFGASLILLLKIIPAKTALSKIDLNVIALLISMMVIVNIVKETGIFQYVAIKTAKLVQGEPFSILLLLMLLTAIFSAFLDNVTTILILSPLSILIAVELGISPVPFLITQAIASNIGGTSTLIGDPPNIMIAYATSLSFNDFLVNLGPLIIIIMLTCILVTVVFFRKTLVVPFERRARIMQFDESSSITDRPFLYKALFVLMLVIVGFLLHDTIHVGPAVIAMTGATLLLIISKSNPDEYFAEIEWITIFFFTGLFIMVGALEELKIIEFLGDRIIAASGNNINAAVFSIIWGSGILSGFIDNIPFVATMIPLIKVLNANYGASIGHVLWWSLSAGACLGGNLTLVGATANVISAGIAQKNGFKITFLEFTRYGIVYTLVSLIVTSIYIYFRYLLL